MSDPSSQDDSHRQADLPASADVFALCCRSRWAGSEQEGFGIIFLERPPPGQAARSGAETELGYDALAAQLAAALDDVFGQP